MDEVPTIDRVTDEEADSFVAAVQATVNQPPREWLYLMNSEGLPLSFDWAWAPFIGKTKGFNPTGERKELAPLPTLIQRIVPHLQENTKKHRIKVPGGRFFFSKEGVCRKDRDGVVIPVLSWKWPNASRPDSYY